jgi:membrane-anchored glycerophosphoryl diester phosphodiesterase (GDPDase)
MMPYFVTNVMSKMNPSTQLAGVSLLLEFLYYIIIYFVMVKIACMYGLMLDRKMRFVEALKTSIQMVKGRGWRILGYYLLIALLSFILIIILCIIPSILWTVTFVTGFAPAMIGLSVLVSVVVYTLMICIQIAISGNMQMAIYRYLEIEHSEDEILQTPEVAFNSTENSDENDPKF